MGAYHTASKQLHAARLHGLTFRGLVVVRGVRFRLRERGEREGVVSRGPPDTTSGADVDRTATFRWGIANYVDDSGQVEGEPRLGRTPLLAGRRWRFPPSQAGGYEIAQSGVCGVRGAVVPTRPHQVADAGTAAVGV